MIVLFFVNQNATLISTQNNNNNQIPVRPTPFVENVKTDDQYVTRNKHIEKIKPLTIYIPLYEAFSMHTCWSTLLYCCSISAYEFIFLSSCFLVVNILFMLL